MKLTLLFLTLFFFSFAGNAQINLPPIFTDHMVLQQNEPIRFWGTTAPKTRVSVVIGRNSKTVKSDDNGNWELELKEMEAGGPYSVYFDTKTERRELRDVHIGEVFYAMGQSNMEWSLGASTGGYQAAQETDDLIRFFRPAHKGAYAPQSSLAGDAPGEKAVWQKANDPGRNEQFSGLAYFFAQKIRQQLPEVAVGIIQVTWGGSKIESWLSPTANGFSSAQKLEQEITADLDERLTREQTDLRAFFGVEIKATDKNAFNRSRQPAVTASIQSLPRAEITLNGKWESEPQLAGLDGVVWLRKVFTLTPQQAQNAAQLQLGPIDDDDFTFVNGRFVGSLVNGWNKNREYLVSAGTLQAGTNELLIRVTDMGGGGGLERSGDHVFLQTTTEQVPLDGKWELFVEHYFPADASFRAAQLPSMIYHGMVAPLGAFPARALVWYQGESNTDNLPAALNYRQQLVTFMKEQRERTRQERLPVFVVQLPAFGAPDESPQPSTWATLRESQAKAVASTSNTFLVPAIDLGLADDIHPSDKKPIADRIFPACREIFYRNKTLPWAHPQVEAVSFKNGKAVLKIKGGTQGLSVRDRYGYLRGFALAEADKKFVWAPARLIDEQTIEVFHPSLKKPVAVRYAWSDNPADANVFGGNGLPLLPFRSDDWEQ